MRLEFEIVGTDLQRFDAWMKEELTEVEMTTGSFSYTGPWPSVLTDRDTSNPYKHRYHWHEVGPEREPHPVLVFTSLPRGRLLASMTADNLQTGLLYVQFECLEEFDQLFDGFIGKLRKQFVVKGAEEPTSVQAHEQHQKRPGREARPEYVEGAKRILSGEKRASVLDDLTNEAMRIGDGLDRRTEKNRIAKGVDGQVKRLRKSARE